MPPALEAICLKAMALRPRTATPRRRPWPTTWNTGWPTNRYGPCGTVAGAAGRWVRHHKGLVGTHGGHTRAGANGCHLAGVTNKS